MTLFEMCLLGGAILIAMLLAGILVMLIIGHRKKSRLLEALDLYRGSAIIFKDDATFQRVVKTAEMRVIEGASSRTAIAGGPSPAQQEEATRQQEHRTDLCASDHASTIGPGHSFGVDEPQKDLNPAANAMHGIVTGAPAADVSPEAPTTIIPRPLLNGLDRFGFPTAMLLEERLRQNLTQRRAIAAIESGMPSAVEPLPEEGRTAAETIDPAQAAALTAQARKLAAVLVDLEEQPPGVDVTTLEKILSGLRKIRPVGDVAGVPTPGTPQVAEDSEAVEDDALETEPEIGLNAHPAADDDHIVEDSHEETGQPVPAEPVTSLDDTSTQLERMIGEGGPDGEPPSADDVDMTSVLGPLTADLAGTPLFEAAMAATMKISRADLQATGASPN